MVEMLILDLHGTYHDDIERVVVNFIYLNELPLKIITGDSCIMRKIVSDLLIEHYFMFHHECYINFGAYIIRDKTR